MTPSVAGPTATKVPAALRAHARALRAAARKRVAPMPLVHRCADPCCCEAPSGAWLRRTEFSVSTHEHYQLIGTLVNHFVGMYKQGNGREAVMTPGEIVGAN